MKVRINDYGHMVLTEEQKVLVHNKLLENSCSSCKAQPGQECKNTNGVHMGRVPTDWDAVKYLESL